MDREKLFDRIHTAHPGINRASDIDWEVARIEAEAAREDTFREVGEWTEKQPTIGDAGWIYKVGRNEVIRLKSGQKPWEE